MLKKVLYAVRFHEMWLNYAEVFNKKSDDFIIESLSN